MVTVGLLITQVVIGAIQPDPIILDVVIFNNQADIQATHGLIMLVVYKGSVIQISMYRGIVVEDLKEISTTVVDVIMAVKRDKQAPTPSSLISGKKQIKK